MTEHQTTKSLETEVLRVLYLPYIYIQAFFFTLLYTLKYSFNVHPFGHTYKHMYTFGINTFELILLCCRPSSLAS